MTTRRGLTGAVVAGGLALLACSTPPPQLSVSCIKGPVDCSCTVGTEPISTPIASCSVADVPNATCCASPGWPTMLSSSCGCSTGAIFCGIVPDYFESIFDGGPTAGCACTVGAYPQSSQVLGATCEPGGWASPPSTVGVCCFYPSSLTAGGSPACACGPSLNCEPGSTRVDSCSAANFPAPSPMSCGSGTQVTSCSGADAGPPDEVDGAGNAPDASPVADASPPEAGVCGSGPASACNQLTNAGAVVTPTCVAASPPAMTGGTLASGTYVLESATAYAASCAGLSLPTGGPTTELVSPGCVQSIDVTGGAQTYTFTTSGNTLSLVQVCPGASSIDMPYTATATTYSELAPLSTGVSIVSVFQRQ